MKPNNLVEFSRSTYAKPDSVKNWSRDATIAPELYPDEIILLEKIPLRKGELLLLGVGGGREAIPLAKIGFDVTGVDFVSEMVEQSKKNALREGLKIDGLVQDISKLEVPNNAFDIVWLSLVMYSSIPTRKRRAEMLKRISRSLKPGGYFVCQFFYDPNRKFSPKTELFRKLFALITFGNLSYEKGDTLWGNGEFIHVFASVDELKTELAEEDFEWIYFHAPKESMKGGIVLKKCQNK